MHKTTVTGNSIEFASHDLWFWKATRLSSGALVISTNIDELGEGGGLYKHEAQQLMFWLQGDLTKGIYTFDNCFDY